MKGRHSIIFYGWAGFAGQMLFLVGAVVFVVVGSSYQRSAIEANSRAQRLQLTNQAIHADFLDAQRSARGYLLTGQGRFLDSYYAERSQFATGLRTARVLAWRAVVPGLDQEGSVASAAFRFTDLALASHHGSPRSKALLGQASAWSDRFDTVSGRLQAQLGLVSAAVAAASQRSLGIGLLATAIVLTAGLMIPVAAGALVLRRAIIPLQGTTDTVHRLAAGQHAARAVAGGPAEVRDLSLSVNYLADESDRLRAEQEERVRLSAVARQTAVRVREHLEPEGVIRAAVTAIRRNVGCDFVWIGLISGGKLTVPEGNREEWGLSGVVVQSLLPEYIEFIAGLYRERSSYCMQDLRSGEAAVLPREWRDLLVGYGGVSLLFTPFGIGHELLGELTLLRTEPGRPWTPAEISAVESVASDVGRGLDHARLYAQEKDLVEKLKDVDRAKSDFLAAVSHDLKAPLTSIVGYAEMLEEDEKRPLSADQHQMLAAIDRNASRLENLIDDVLTMSRIEMGTFQSLLRPVDLAAVVRGAVGEIRVTAQEQRLDLRLSGAGDDLVVLGDGDQLDRALVNLLTNAVKYTPPGGRVEVLVGRDGDQAVLAVRDTGIGIPGGDQQSVFTRFFRASNAVTRSIPGTGLGLAIVASIVSNHQGQVTVQSREGAGTTVTVRLPLAAAGPPGNGRAAATGGSGGETSGSAQVTAGPREGDSP